MAHFTVRARDAAARLGRLSTGHGTLDTPLLYPVYNPNQPLVSPREMREAGAQAIMTNSYILYKSGHLREAALERGVHGLLDFDGVVATDSGAYQLYRYGKIDVSNLDVIRFQHAIGADVGSIVDVPMSDRIGREEAERGVAKTIEAAREWASIRDELEGTLWIGTPQGSVYQDLAERAARELASLPFDYYGVGSLKIALEEYRYSTQVDHFIAVRRRLPAGKPVHFWGVGHPSTFALFAAMGADSFDSAAYALFARDLRYMTPEGTLTLGEIEEFPCSCPICSKYDPKDLKNMPREEAVRLIALHNLYVSFSEMRRVREAIRGGWLWELVQERVRSHPRLLEALYRLLSGHSDYLEEREPFTKRTGLFYSGIETAMRPEVVRARRLLNRFDGGRKIRIPLFGEVPVGLRYTYPFGHISAPSWDERGILDPDPTEILTSVLTYQFGSEAKLAFSDPRVETSKSTGMPRNVYDGGVRVGMIRPGDGLFVPSIEGAKRLLRVLPRPRGRVVVAEEAADMVSRGTSVFTQFVEDADPSIRPYTEVMIVDPGDRLLATGKTILSAFEVPEFPPGQVFVRVRHHILPRRSKNRGDSPEKS